MSARVRVGWLLLLLAVYASRFWSCVSALNREARPLDAPYHSVDPHGFLLIPAFLAAVIFVLPTCWLLFGGWIGRGATPPEPALVRSAQWIAVVVLIGSPTAFQLFYFVALPIAAAWPIAISSLAWLGVVIVAMSHRSARLPSALHAFDRHPAIAWVVVLLVASPNVALGTLWLVQRA